MNAVYRGPNISSSSFASVRALVLVGTDFLVAVLPLRKRIGGILSAFCLYDQAGLICVECNCYAYSQV